MSDSEEIPSKRCYKCGLTKPLDAFSRRKTAKDGRDNCCKACVAEYQAANADAIRTQRRVWNAANPDYKRAYDAANAEHIRAYNTTNAEHIRERKHAYNTANAEHIRERKRAWRAANAKTLREKKRAWQAANRAANPEMYRAAKHRRRARLKGNGGSFTTQDLRLLGVTQGGYCAYCQGFHGDALTIDHIIRIAQGGRHEAGNICLACSRCNYSKWNRTPDEWVNRWYYDWQQRDPEYIPPHWYD